MNKPSNTVTYSKCNLRGFCIPAGLNDKDYARIDELITVRQRVQRGHYLFRNGDKFSSLYAIRSGFFKTCVATKDGREQVSGFQMAGEITGLDGIVKSEHSCDAIALEDAEVCVIKYESVLKVAQEMDVFQHHMYKILSREIVRSASVMLHLGSLRAEERVATFLLDLTQRLQARGFSESEIVLRMTREEIGSYLGLKLETVSRTFSKFARDGTLAVKQRHIRIHKPEELMRIANHQFCH
ncbi:Transcriptional activator protein Anr [Polaromonas vacuolata]|uniref:Transcriptional activator protein Anr n=1 Tax=Polaromonas vacuolata TaxID=37448 RepID=A0A6H2HA09_9BURK|nr:helix-turn-helix domain-containing protein [Polaromonas vacuolata]QJC56645.1 Transcriptional activator protein Anr [Polaromonas vacuolata]QJC56695.1 Transcriptional activator protein Anr [Polaromonas vacuolata]